MTQSYWANLTHVVRQLNTIPGTSKVGVVWHDSFTGANEEAFFYDSNTPEVIKLPGRVEDVFIVGDWELKHIDGDHDDSDALQNAMLRMIKQAGVTVNDMIFTAEDGSLKPSATGYRGTIYVRSSMIGDNGT